MSSKYLFFIFFLISSLVFAQSEESGWRVSAPEDVIAEQTPHLQNENYENFSEHSAVYERFMSQNRKLIADKNFKKAREFLAPFLDQMRERLGFVTNASVDFDLKNFSPEQAQIVLSQQMGQNGTYELALTNLAPETREILVAAINKSTPERFSESLFKYKRTLLLYITAVLGESNALAFVDKAAVSERIFSDFLFLVAPAVRFNVSGVDRYLVFYEYELNNSAPQEGFDLEVIQLVRDYHPYFMSFSTNKDNGDKDFSRFKNFQRNAIRRILSRKRIRKPASESITTDSVTAVLETSSSGKLLFDVRTLFDVARSELPGELQVQQLKDYLTSSSMTWEQSQIQVQSAFTHSSRQIKVTLLGFPLSSKFVATSLNYYLDDLKTFFEYAKKVLIKKNTLENRDLVYDCLVRQSLASVHNFNCDEAIVSTSFLDPYARKNFAELYTRLLRFSRITFEQTEVIEYNSNMIALCEQLKKTQAEMLNSFKSTSISYMPSLINIQGPSFKSVDTGIRANLCGSSLNPLLQ